MDKCPVFFQTKNQDLKYLTWHSYMLAGKFYLFIYLFEIKASPEDHTYKWFLFCRVLIITSCKFIILAEPLTKST